MFLQFLTSESHLREKNENSTQKESPQVDAKKVNQKATKNGKKARAPVPSSVQPGNPKNLGPKQALRPKLPPPLVACACTPTHGARQTMKAH